MSLNLQEVEAYFAHLPVTCEAGVFSDTINNSKSVISVAKIGES